MKFKSDTHYDMQDWLRDNVHNILILLAFLIMLGGGLVGIIRDVPEAQAAPPDRNMERLIQAEERQAKALEELVRQSRNLKVCECK